MTGAVNKALEIKAIHGDSGSGKKGGWDGGSPRFMRPTRIRERGCM